MDNNKILVTVNGVLVGLASSGPGGTHVFRTYTHAPSRTCRFLVDNRDLLSRLEMFIWLTIDCWTFFRGDEGVDYMRRLGVWKEMTDKCHKKNIITMLMENSLSWRKHVHYWNKEVTSSICLRIQTPFTKNFRYLFIYFFL